MPHYRLFTEQQAALVKEWAKGRPRIELTELINQEFNMQLEHKQIISYMKNNKITCGIDARFKKGRESHNKGKKGVGGYEPTQFKKGQKPPNYKPVGTERINTDGYIDIKIADPNKWLAKHIIIWEEANGPIPEGHCLIFADRNKMNVTLENLLLITRKQLMIMNNKKLIQDDIESTKTGVIIADISAKASERKRNDRKRMALG